MQDTRNGLRVRQHASDLTHRPVRIDRLKLPRIHVRIPIGHIDHVVIVLHSRVRKLREEPARVQIVIILIDLPNSLAHLQMSLKIIHPVALGTVDRDAAVGTFEMRMSRRLTRFVRRGGLASFRVMRGGRHASLLVTGVWAKGVLLDERGALANCR